MASVASFTPPSTPGVGMRRRGPKSLPSLPLSAFSAPNSGTSEAFPLAPSPSTVHPESIVDAHVIISKDFTLDQWKKEAGDVLGSRSGGTVLLLHGDRSEVAEIASQLDTADVLAVGVPFDIENPTSSQFSDLDLKTRKTLYTTVKQLAPGSNEGLRWALQQGCPVDVDVQVTFSDASFESFQELISSASADLAQSGPIILSNVLPPPHDLSLPIVKLLNDSTYRAFQAQIAALSLYPRSFVKFTPPSWAAPTPSSPPAGASADDMAAKQKREWKRRIKMFVGPVIEAFGCQRIIFGSSPSTSTTGSSNASDWYEIARESLAELGLEQEDIDAVFSQNAKKVYGPSEA
jgi:hypothetical protein